MNYDQQVVDSLTKAIENKGFFVLWGSRLYGCQRPDSDHDFQLIVHDADVEDVRVLLSRGWNSRRGDVHLHTLSEYEEAVDNCKPWAIETMFAPDELYTGGWTYTPPRRVHKKTLRDEFARTASNSYVKCKKKLIVHGDYAPLIAKKSMFHSIRILDYGRQIAEKQQIYDFASCNHYLDQLLSMESKWDVIEKTFKPIYNAYASALREACPKSS